MKLLQNIALTFLFFLNTAFLIFGQQVKELYTIVEYPAVPAKYCDLEEEMKETSGIIFFEGSIWTINDSGGNPEIYKIDKATGTVSQMVSIANGSNRDWEDITQDDKYIYAGDFGNNDGNRTDLKIYKINKADITGKKKVTVDATIIGFSYSDQQSFEENSHNHNFDCESLISVGDSLMIFSKDWADDKTRMYKIPKIPGQYNIDPLETFDADGLVSGADFSEVDHKLVLIGYKDHIPFIFLVNDFNGRTLLGKEIFRFNLFKMKGSQTEGVAWSTGETVLFTTEQTKSYPQQAFEFNFQKVFKIMGK
jgi:hypothetical protein